MRISDWSSDVCSSDLLGREPLGKVPLSAVAMERKGTSTERGDEQRAVRARNQERRELTQQLRDISARIAETMRRSEEHTSELQSLMRISYAVFCLKKKKNYTQKSTTNQPSQSRP